MFEFGLYALILLLLALAFVVVPLMLTKTVARESDDAINIELAQRKLKELKAELAGGSLSQAQFDAARQELELGLYHDLQGGSQQYSASNGRWLIVPLLFFIPLSSLGLYAWLGDFRAFDKTQTVAQAPQADSPSAAQIEQMVAKLENKLNQQPNDVKGWLMLGRSYKAMKRFAEAVVALKKAQALQPNDPEILLQIADALAVENNGSLQGESSQLIEQALKLQPDNEIGLWLLGMSKAEVGQYDQAIALWRKLQQHYQPDQPDYQEVQEMINTALERMGKPAEAGTRSDTPAAVSATPITARVGLADALKSAVSPEDSVLIYVKAANGPKMPLAAVKRQVKDLPLSITFDDSMAMMPSMKPSMVDDVVVTARVSKTGNAIPQSGEPIGSRQVKGEQRQNVNLVIGERVP